MSAPQPDKEGSLGLILALRDMSAVCPEATGVRVWVKKIAEGSAAEGHVAAGDELRTIGGQKPTDVRRMVHTTWGLKDVAQALSGPVGTSCQLSFFNHGLQKEYSVKLTRTRVKAQVNRQDSNGETAAIVEAVCLCLLVLLGLWVGISFMLRLPALTALLPDEAKQAMYGGLQSAQGLNGGGMTSLATAAVFGMFPLLITLTGIASLASSIRTVLLYAMLLIGGWGALVYLVDYETVWVPPDDLSLRGKTTIVTGATTAVGFEVTKKLQALGATVILACQDTNACSAALYELTQEYTPSDGAWTVMALKVDLCSRQSIESFASEFKSLYAKLDFLIYNVGDQQCEPPSGSDRLSSKHAGQTHLANVLKDAMEHSGDERTRIVTTTTAAQWLAPYNTSTFFEDDTSHKAGLSDASRSLESITGSPGDLLSNVLFSYELSRRWHNDSDGSGVISASVGVGIIAMSEFGSSLPTKMVNRILSAVMRPARLISLPVIYALVAPMSEIRSGGFIDAQGRVVSWYPGKGSSGVIATQLWEKTEQALIQ